MKKIKKLQLRCGVILEHNQLKNIIGGTEIKTYHYYLRCDQDYEAGFEVNDCERTTAEQFCGPELKNTVCVSTYY